MRIQMPPCRIISIHSLRMEGDIHTHIMHYKLIYFNPLPPHGGRPVSGLKNQMQILFQSTPSAWRETVYTRVYRQADSIFQSTPSAWRETINTGYRNMTGKNFNPLPPHGGRPEENAQAYSDMHFNPLPPHGGRPTTGAQCCPLRIFQSTPSAWRETHRCRNHTFSSPISIHSLRMEGDASVCKSFLSVYISIHSLRMEGDRVQAHRGTGRCHFNPLPPHGGRRSDGEELSRRVPYFNPLPPHGGRLE